MHVIDTYVGNRNAEGGAACPAVGDHETLVVGENERRRSRFRATTEAGTEVGVVLGRELRADDVLAGDDLTVVIELERIEALVVDLAAATDPFAAVELGHAAGNRHWELAVRDGAALFPVTDSVERMRSALEPSLPAGATLSTERVSPALFDDAGVAHTHSHGYGEDGEGS
jgi:urease accessory protein